MRALLALSVLALVWPGEVQAEWWSTMSLYQIYPRSFKDSDGDGIGDLEGVSNKLQHLVDSNVDAFWLSPIYPSPMVDFGYDISDFVAIDPLYGSIEDFDNLISTAHNLSLKVIMDFVPNHSSDEHEWFKKSVDKIEPYTDYYIWNEGKIVDGVRRPPNNWVSVFRGSAWTWNEKRQAYFFHQFASRQPDLNYRNKRVVEEMKNVIRFWLNRGVDGFRVDAVPHLFEVEDLRDEPLSNLTNDPDSYGYTDHVFTKDRKETYEMVREWRKVIDEYSDSSVGPRIIVIEAYTDIEGTMKYYTYGAHFPFNFGLVGSVNDKSKAADFKNLIETWMRAVPPGAVSNWVAGNHDKNRLVSRFGKERAPAITIMTQLLPGVSITYNGEEIGMEDTKISWEETKDPQGCNAGKTGFEAASRDPERTPFQWDDTTSAGFSTNPVTWLPVNENYKTVNLAAEKEAEDSYYNLYQMVSELRKWPAVRFGKLDVYLINDDVLAFSRELEGSKSIYVVINFSNAPQTVNLTSQFKDIMASVEVYLSTLDSGMNSGRLVDAENVSIPASGTVIFVSTEPSN